MSEQHNSITTLNKAISILEVLAHHPEGLPLKKISAETGLNKSTAYRILQAFEKKAYVKQDTNGGSYYIGHGMLVYYPAISNYDFSKICLEYMQAFTDKSGYSTSLAVLSGNNMVTLDVCQPKGHSQIRVSADVGYYAELYSTASGKLFLSQFSDSELRDYFDGKELVPFTKTTITNKEDLIRELAEIRKNGFSMENEENQENILSIAAPITDSSNTVKASFVVTVLKQMIGPVDLLKLIEEIKIYAKKTSDSVSHLVVTP